MALPFSLPFANSLIGNLIILFILAVVMYLMSSKFKIEGNIGFAYTVYPWVATFPETLVSSITAVLGYPVVAIWNSVFSATFDSAVVFGVSALIHGKVEFRPRYLVIPTVLGGMIFSSLIVSDFRIGVFDGFILYVYLIAVSIIAIALYGFRVRVRDWPKIIFGLIGLALVAVVFSFYVMALADLINHKIAGIVAAALTSFPDLIISIVYGIESDISQSEVLGCIMHDFAENMATAAIIAGMFGVEIVDSNPLLTAIVVSLTMTILLATTIDGDIDIYDSILLISSFILMSFFSLIL